MEQSTVKPSYYYDEDESTDNDDLERKKDEESKNLFINRLKIILSSTEISPREFLELWNAFDSDGEYSSHFQSLNLHR